MADFLTRYLTNFVHFRIYLVHPPLEYPKNGVTTPGFGPKTRFFTGKCAYTTVMSTHIPHATNQIILPAIISLLGHLGFLFRAKPVT